MKNKSYLPNPNEQIGEVKEKNHHNPQQRGDVSTILAIHHLFAPPNNGYGRLGKAKALFKGEGEDIMTISRRKFIQGALGTALGTGAIVAGGMTLSGCSSDSGTSSSSTGSGSESSSGVWAPIVAEPISDDECQETYDCDICVVGAGCAGASAAMYAAINGANTVIMQDESQVICTASAGSHAGVWNCKRGTDLGIQWNVPSDMQDFSDQANGNFNFQLVNTVINQTGNVIDWINETLEIPEDELFVNVVDGNHAGYTWIGKDGLWGVVKGMGDKATENGATLLTETRGVQLVGDVNGVTGVIGQTADGYVKVNASKGVILCTGDVADNMDILVEYLPIAAYLNTERPNRVGQGDGTKMGLQIGAELENAPANIQVHLVAAAKDVTDGNASTASYPAVPWLHVNKDGERFTNENISYVNLGMAAALQPDHTIYQIFDSRWEEHVLDYPKSFFPTGEYGPIEPAVESGLNAWSADTIEGLAEACGLPAKTLVATVNRYNELVASGIDSDFGVDPQYFQWNGIIQPPFYAVAYWPNVYAVGAGLKCNENLQVVTPDDKPIPGLYAAGNAGGSFFGYYYPVSGFSAAGVSHALVGGPLAVSHALGLSLDDLAK